MPTYVRKGMQFVSTYADSNALWKVKSKKGSGVWLCEIVNEPIEINGKTYESDYTGVQKVFRSKEIIDAVNREELYQKSANEHDQFYSILVPGQIIHYNNGFGAYVRCEVVEENGKNKLKPIALLGNWNDLPRRDPSGEIYYPYHSKLVHNGKLFEPNYTNLWEAVHGTSKSMKNHPDPTKMEPIDLSVPEMTLEEEKNAQLWKILRQINEMLDNAIDPKAALESIQKLATVALKAA